MRVTRGPCRRSGTHKFDDLTTDDILDKVYGLRRGILDLPKDKHLKPRPREGRLGIIFGSWLAEGLTIWDISWVYLYSLGNAISSERSPPQMRVRIVGRVGAVWRCDRSNGVWDRSHVCSFVSHQKPRINTSISPQRSCRRSGTAYPPPPRTGAG